LHVFATGTEVYILAKNYFYICFTFFNSQDPVEEDRSLWTTTSKYLHPDLDPETARFILRYTSDEFCRMVREESDVRNTYRGKTF
jgi:hypothetical protein